MKSNSEVAENRFLGTISTSSLRNLLPRSISGKNKSNSILRKTKSDAENTPPVDSNIQIERSEIVSKLSKSPRPQIAVSDPQIELQEEVSTGLNGQCEVDLRSDSPVKVTAEDLWLKVVVRVRPSNEREKGRDWLVTKVSSESLCVGDRNFCFDSVLDSKSNQEDVFQLVGVPLVKNALAGYNNTILSYGQSGSGKTYTMWGPPSAIVEGPSPSSHQGIVPRIFQMLFSEIQKEEDHVDGKQINYQCRCSFLEIYNEQIGDLLDPSQRNLEIKDDPKNGLYVENLTEEYVTSYEDITQILIKGLSSRKVGATSVNSKSSRSHIVFTCIVESWCKGSSSKCFSSSKTSRISLVDLAGLDKNRRDDLGRQELIEGKKVKKSLSKLGHLIDALAKGSQSGTHNDVLYRGSCLTHLLRESLGGNSKLTVICAISPDNKCSAEIMRTLRFGQRVKSIKNEPVINEINEDDVNDLSDQIRQLKEELIRAKSNENSLTGNKFGYLNGQNVRDSLNQLRVSLNRSLILPRIDNDSEEEVNVDMHDVRELCQQFDKLHGSHEGKSGRLSDQRDSIEYFSVDESSEADLMSEDDDIHFPEETEMEEINLDVPTNAISMDLSSCKTSEAIEPPLRSSLSISISEAIKHPLRSSLSISTCLRSSVLQEPTLSESPKIGNIQRRSMAMSSSFLASENMSRSSNLKPDVLRQSPRQSEIRSSLHSSKIFPGPTESLAASLQRGLQIIDYHQQNSPSSRSSMAFSFEHLTLKPCPEVDKADASVQTSSGERSSTDFLCASCQQKISSNDSNEVQNGSEAWTLTVDEAPKSQDGGNVLAEAKKREQELENICKEQAVKIEQLNHLVEQYKHGQASTLLCLEASKNEIPSEEQMLQGGGYNVENHQPEIMKEVREELDREYSDTAFDKNEKEALLTEIRSLKRKLQSYTEASPNKSIDEKLRSSSLLLQSINLRRSLRPQDNSKEELEMERQMWTEMESGWISLTDELRVNLESIRQRAEKVEMELRLEKKCTEELDDALNRSILGHARMIEHYADLQDKYDDLLGKHRAIMEGIAEVKRAAAKAGKKGYGPRAAKALAAELSALRVERERERDFLKKENKSLRIQLRDTAEAVHAAGELLVRLREAEQVAAVAEENYANAQQENEKLRKQMEKMKRKHKMEAITMKQYLAESKLPESALRPLYREDSDMTSHTNTSPHCEDDQAWRAEFGAIYQEHY